MQQFPLSHWAEGFPEDVPTPFNDHSHLDANAGGDHDLQQSIRRMIEVSADCWQPLILAIDGSGIRGYAILDILDDLMS